MRDKLIHFLHGFSAVERRDFAAYLQSPIFNRREKLTQLFDFIAGRTLKSEPVEFDEEAAFKAIYPGEKFGPNKIRKLKNALLTQVQEFLEFEVWRAGRKASPPDVLIALNNRGDQDHFSHYYQKTLDKQEKMRASLEGLEAVFRRELERARADSTARKKESSFPAVMQTLREVELTRMLKFTYLSLVREKIVGEVSCPRVFRELVGTLEVGDLQGPLAKMYHLLCVSVLNPDNFEALQELKQLLQAEGRDIATEEIRDIYLGAINNFTWQNVLTKDEKLAELWALNRGMYELVVRERGNPLRLEQFKNMVMIGCRLAEYEWVRAFIEEAPQYLRGADDAIEVAGTFNTGVLYFYRGDFEAAESKFHRAMGILEDVFYELDGRAYLLMIYYETGDTRAMESLLHAFRMYLERGERVSENHRSNYGEFIRLFRRMLGLRPDDRARIEKLEKEIVRSEFRTGQSWLLEKLAAL